MTGPDWSDIVRRAENTPAATLAECYGLADEFSDVVVCALDKATGDVRYWASADSQQKAIDLLGSVLERELNRDT